MLKIESIEIKNEVGEVVEIQPSIPFSEFPEGQREARPDESGRLCWYVTPLPKA